MKKYFLLFALGFIQIAFSQVVRLQPTFATENDSITIILDASQPGAEEILNYSGIIYAHTGVTIDSLGTIKDWQYVIADWNTNISKAALVRIISQSLQIYYRLFQEQFYNVQNPNVKILKLAFCI